MTPEPSSQHLPEPSILLTLGDNVGAMRTMMEVHLKTQVEQSKQLDDHSTRLGSLEGLRWKAGALCLSVAGVLGTLSCFIDWSVFKLVVGK